MDFRNPGSFNGANRDQPCRYDDLGRLEKATGSDLSGAWQRRFVYDRWGNRTQVWNATVGGSQIQQVNLALIGSAPSNGVSSYWDTAATGGATKTVSYDAAGNTTNDGTYSFTYDAENRIVQVNAVATGALVATYTYDSANRRIKKTVGATTTCSVWEGAQVIAEYNNAAAPGSPNTEYIYTGGRMLAEERTGSGTTRFFHQDRLSTRLTTNSTGAVLGTQSHLPFGEQLTESSEQQKWKFTTYERNSETGDDYAINRGYWPTLGRFRQADKLAGGITDPQSLNRYAYVLNDPANLADPSGNAPGPSLFGSYFLDASLRQYGLFIDGFEVQPGQAGLFFGLLSSGAGVIGPIGATAFLGSGGVTYLSLDSGRGQLPDGTIHLGVTLVEVTDSPIVVILTALQSFPQGTPDVYIEFFNKVFADTLRRLNKKKCANLFGGEEAAVSALSNTEYRFLPLPSGGPKPDPKTGQPTVVGAQTNSPTSVFINTLGPFLNNRMLIPRVGFRTLDFGTGLSGKSFGSLILLHELGHQVGAFGPDTNNQELNLKHTRKVLNACF